MLAYCVLSEAIRDGSSSFSLMLQMWDGMAGNMPRTRPPNLICRYKDQEIFPPIPKSKWPP